MRKIGIVVVGMAMLAGCVAARAGRTGLDFNDMAVRDVWGGESHRDILERVGKPVQKVVYEDGTELWIYFYATELKSKSAYLLFRKGRLVREPNADLAKPRDPAADLPAPVSTSKPKKKVRPKKTARKSLGPWKEIASWSGSGIKNTETFLVPSNEWRIRWKTWPGKYGDMNFQIFVNSDSGGMVGVAANIMGKGSDTSYHRGTGKYHLTINSGQSFQVIVEVKR